MPLKPFKNKAFSGVNKRRNSVDKRWKKNVDKWNKSGNGKNEYKNMQLKVNKYKNKKSYPQKMWISLELWKIGMWEKWKTKNKESCREKTCVFFALVI